MKLNPKYRIVTKDQSFFRIQKRFFLFFYIDLQVSHNGGRIPIDFKTIDDARNHIHMRIYNEEELPSKPWVVVE